MEMPLKAQIYESDSSCPTWQLVVPKESDDPDLKIALERIAKYRRDWPRLVREPIQDMLKFGNWIDSDIPVDDPAVMMLLSHHGDNKIFFVRGGTEVGASSVRKLFKKPSLAILNGCGTAGAGASLFLHNLNLSGIATVVASSAEVEPEMAGYFLECLYVGLEANKGVDNNAARAYFNAVSCLRDQPKTSSEKFGAMALKFVLLGNGSFKICPPDLKP
jgi:hypothetical protein